MSDDIFSATLSLHACEMQRAQDIAQKTTRLAIRKPAPDTFAEAMDLSRATFHRAMALQRNWAQDWAHWAHYAGSLAGADTLPKFTERSGNIALRAQAQWASQMTEATTLMENFTVSYSYWLSKQVE